MTITAETVTELDAAGWRIEHELRTTEPGHARGPGIQQAHFVCGRCRQSVFNLSPDISGGGYLISLGELAAGILLHVRQAHCDGGGVLLDK
jgi:hypothetical protein